MLVVALLIILITGCTHTTLIKPLSDTELGYATLCTWEHKQPTNCVADTTRSTINDKFLQSILDELNMIRDELNASRKDEYKRKAL